MQNSLGNDLMKHRCAADHFQKRCVISKQSQVKLDLSLRGMVVAYAVMSIYPCALVCLCRYAI